MKTVATSSGDEIPVTRVIEYLERRRKDVDAIRVALEGRDSAALRHIVHRIKGNAGLYGLAEVGVMANEVIDVLDRGNWDDVRRLSTDLSRRIDSERRRFGPKP